MTRLVAMTVLLAGLIVAGASSPAWAAQMEITLDPGADSSPFEMKYQRTMSIEYKDGGDLYDILNGKQWTVSDAAGFEDLGVQDLAQSLNNKIISDGSQAQVRDLGVNYKYTLYGGESSASVDYTIILEGELSNYVITRDTDAERTLIDMGWRGMTVTNGVTVNGAEINLPGSILRVQEPEVYDMLRGTEAERILNLPLIRAEFIGGQPLDRWHFLFDPAGITVDAKRLGLDESIAGSVVSKWTMGESSFREGILTEERDEANLVLDRPYTIKSVQPIPIANLSVIGYGVADNLQEIEVAGVTPTAPPGFGQLATGNFPIFIVYGMAGIAAVAGVAFFFVSSRTLKNEAQGQQGIDPSRLVGYQTSASSGGYQTNRGEAQLRDDSGYQKTRNVYE